MTRWMGFARCNGASAMSMTIVEQFGLEMMP